MSAQLIPLLKWALDNMQFVSPDPHPDSEYDFCQICNRPEWDHKPDCKGVEWKRQAKEAISEQ